MSLINLLSTSILLKRIIPLTITTILFVISGNLNAQTKPKTPNQKTNQTVKPKTPNQKTNQTVTGKKFLEMYLKNITEEGQTGLEYWCSESEDIASTLFTPTQYKILGNKLGDDKNYLATVTIHSTNKGGSPIVKNWRFWITKGKSILEQEMKKNGSSSSSITGGWCIRNMYDF